MPDPTPLYKTTIVIWSTYPGYTRELPDLAQQADDGDAYCSEQTSVLISDPASDPDITDDALEFFADQEAPDA